MLRSLSTLAASSIVAALFFAPAASHATSMVAFTEEDLTHIADAIVIADVVKVETESQLVPSANGFGTMISTRTTLKVVESWKGVHVAGDELPVRELGGVSDKKMTKVSATAGFLKGERVLCYLYYRASKNEYELVGWTQGKFTLLQNGRGGWDVSKIHVPVEEWGHTYVAAEHENRAIRGRDLAETAMSVKRVVAADVKAGVNWRQMPQYKGINGVSK